MPITEDTMNIDNLKNLETPKDLESDYLKAIWYDLHEDWEEAHRIVQSHNTVPAMWIHAYLHREEGDIPNSKFWYGSAGKVYPGNLLFEDELEIILNEITEK
jgi:hypothetical protein